MIPTNILQMLAQIRQNPMQILSRYNIPQNIANNPQAILQHMMNNGTISQSQFNQAMETAKSFGINI